jgi:uncharacterized protein (DUF885 family)
MTAFFAAEWEYQLEHSPEFATYVGDTRFNDRMGDYSAEAEAREAEHAKQQLERLKALPSAGLDEQQTISREIMQPAEGMGDACEPDERDSSGYCCDVRADSAAHRAGLSKLHRSTAAGAASF